MSNLISVTSPYAHDMILQALDVCIAGYPDAAEIRPVESTVLVGFMLEGNTLYYSPASVLNQSLNDLCDIIHNVYLTYYLNKVPLACKLRLDMSVQH